MRIAHVNFGGEQTLVTTIRARAKATEAAGLPVDYYLINKNLDNVSEGNCYFVKERVPFGLSRLHPYAHNIFRIGSLPKYVPLDDYDYIVLRYVKLPYAGRGFYKKYGKKIITEHHTLAGEEIRSKPTLIRRIAAALEDYLRPRFLTRTAGIIGVTGEITEYAQKGLKGIPGCVITNGVEVDSIPEYPAAEFDGKKLNLVFASTRFFSWQGLDRLLAGLQQYKGSVSIELVLLGLLENKEKQLIELINDDKSNVDIVCPGYVTGKEKDKAYAKANLAIASLGLFRKRMEEACARKTREYIAGGLPFIYAYYDPDVPEKSDFAMCLSNDESPINIDAVIEFAGRMAEQPELPAVMRTFAREHLDWQVKTRQMVNFVTTGLLNEA